MAICQKERKIIYRDELAAKMALARLVWKDHGEKRIYPCGNHFHTTSKRRGGRNRR